MKIGLSDRIQSLAASATMAVAEKARQLRDAGVAVVSFGAGEPDFDTPQHIKDAACAAIADGDTKYPSPVSGRTVLREAVCAYLKRYGGVAYEPEQVCVTVGAKDAIHLALATVLNPGDEVVIPAPYWVSYPEQVRLVGGAPVIVPGDAHSGKLTPEALRRALSPRARVLILNSPTNPTGAVYTRAELQALAAVMRETRALVLSDEIYHRLSFEESPSASFAAIPGMAERTITVNGMSKSYAMTGWRLGYAAGPQQIIAGMARMQGQTTSGAASFVQAAAVAALTGDQECVERMRAAYVTRAGRMWQALSAMAGVRCARPAGAFYCFPDVSGAYERLGVRDADGFAECVLDRAHVALVAGTAFGSTQHVRLSFAASDAQIDEGLARLSKLLG